MADNCRYNGGYFDGFVVDMMTVSQFKQAVRVALTGIEHGAPITEVMMVLGKDETLRRLRMAIKAINVRM